MLRSLEPVRAGLAVRHACTLARVHSTHRRLAPCLRGAAKKSAVVIENATVCARALHDFEGASLEIFFRAGRRGRARGADGGRVRVLDSLSADWSDGMPKKRLSPEKKMQFHAAAAKQHPRKMPGA